MRKAVAVYIVLLHAALAWLFVVHKTAYPSRYVHETQTLLHRADPMVPDGAAIFLGDSITQGMPVDAVTEQAVNFGVGWQTTDDLAESLATYKSLARASVIYLNIGTNDMGRKVDMSKQFQKVLSALPEKPIVWSGIVPGLEVGKIAEANEIAKELCSRLSSVRFCGYLVLG